MLNLRTTLDIFFRKVAPAAVLEHIGNPLKKEAHFIPEDNFFEGQAIGLLPGNSFDEVANILTLAKQEWLNNPEITGNSKQLSVFHLPLFFARAVLEEANQQPQCKYKEFLRWREISLKLGEDIFTTAFFAWLDILGNRERSFFGWRPLISSNNPRLKTILNKGLAENHFHLRGSGPQFDLSWLCLMNHISGRDIEFKKIEQRLEPDLLTDFKRQNSSLYDKIKQAALIRAYLFRLLQGHNPDDAIFKDRVKLLKNRDLLDLYLPDLQREINGLKKLCGQQFAHHEVLDYALPPNITEANYRANTYLYGERKFMYRVLQEIYRADNQSRIYQQADLFYVYLLIKNQLAAELVQTNDSVGFKNFSKYQDRKDLFVDNFPLYSNALSKLAVKGSIKNQHIKSLEARIAPKDSIAALSATIAKLDEIVEKNYGHDSEAELWLKKKHVEKVEAEQYLPVKEQSADEPTHFYTVHFIKRTDDTLAKKGEGIKELVSMVTCRHAQKRQEVKRQAEVIAALRSGLCKEGKRILGIDAASSEIGCRPEVFAQAFRYLRRHQPAKDYAHLKDFANPELKATFHAGEDFLDLSDGLRAIDEAIRFLNLHRGDRIGHALALGTAAREYYKSKNSCIILPKQDLLDNLVWILAKIRLYRLNVNDGLTDNLRKKARGLFDDIFGSALSEKSETIANNWQAYDDHLYYDSWKLRGDAPETYNTGKYLNTAATTFWQRSGRNDYTDLKEVRENALAVRIYYLYHYHPQVKFQGQQMTEFKICPEYVEAIEQIQKEMQREISEKGLAIECNPSSNYKIGSFERYEKHPIINMYNLGLTADPEKLSKCPQLFVSINTDDQGVFDTCLENEFALMAIALEKAKDENGKPLYNQAMIYDWLDRVRQMGIEMSFNKREN